MAATKGDKHKVRNTAIGRPREYDYEKEAQELDEWSQTDDALNLVDFTDKKPYLAQDLTDFAQRSIAFALALRKAKERINRRRERAVAEGRLNYGVWNRYASLRDKELLEHERAEKKFEADLRLKQLESQASDLVSVLINKATNTSRDLIQIDQKPSDD